MQSGFDVDKVELEDVLSSETAKSLMMEVGPRSQPTVVGRARNNRGGTLELLATTSWNGSFDMAPPDSVGAGEMINYYHDGSSGAVIFGQQVSTANAAAYLLAWVFTGKTYRVYVKCGPVSEVHYNGWETAALDSLNSSGSESSASHTGTTSSAQARIQREPGTYPMSYVQAIFN